MICVGYDCNVCKNKIKKADGWKPACKAFPDGIPIDLYYAEPSKLEECNNGIKYEKKA